LCVCLIDSKTGQATFSLQWHITAKCDQKCKHCYMYDSPFYESEKNNELSLSDCKAIIDDFLTPKALKKEVYILQEAIRCFAMTSLTFLNIRPVKTFFRWV